MRLENEEAQTWFARLNVLLVDGVLLAERLGQHLHKVLGCNLLWHYH